jgi:nucleotide-binding universal stress UspA family protein
MSSEAMVAHSILVAYDGSPESIHALGEAAELARLTAARLSIVGVVPLVSPSFGIAMPMGDAAARTLADARSALESQRTRLASSGLANVEAHLLEGEPVSAIVRFVESRGIDLIVVGSRGLDALGRFFLGSVSDGILHYATCSVLVVKTPRASSKPAA